MNLFLSKLTGKLWSTSRLEAHIAQMEADIARYRQVEQSAELAEYNQLKQIVESTEFVQKKHNLTTTKYKTTKCYQLLQELKRLEKNKTLQMYFTVKNSNLLSEYEQFRASDEVDKLSDKKLVSQSPELKKLLSFKKSKEYKTYLQHQQSTLPARYEELKKEVSTDEFKKENTFWSNSKRWFTTEEYQQETRLKQLSADSNIKFFLSQDSRKIAEMEGYKLTFSDDFKWVKLQDSKWRPGFSYKNKALKSQHSFTNEQQANNGGKNVSISDGVFTIQTKRETITSAAWDVKKGFVNKEFEYTSDVVQTAESFRQQEGLFMIKMRTGGKIHHAAWLGADSKLPLLTLFHFNGKNIVVGNTTTNGFDGDKVTGLKPSNYFVYSLHWTKNEMVWYVNNIEVYRTQLNIPKQELYLALSSFISENQKAQEGKLEVDWIRIYQF